MKQKHFLISLAVLAIGISVDAQTKDNVKTTFQTSREWKPSIDNRADAVMVYGVGGNPSDKSRKLSFEERVKSWKERGYIIHFMTGIAWGEYQAYFTGQWDGKWHLDEGQVTQAGDTIWHGHMVPYIVPSENFLSYLSLNFGQEPVTVSLLRRNGKNTMASSGDRNTSLRKILTCRTSSSITCTIVH